MNEWIEKYKEQMDSRYETFKIAFECLHSMPEHKIVETGCVRQKDDWGAGYSTVLFGEFCSLYGGSIVSIDSVQEHIDRSKILANQYEKFITYIHQDSVECLKSWTSLIDLLYLDSMDVPIHEGADRIPCQEHCLNEFKAAESKLHKNSIVLIDDYFNGDGKGRLAEKYIQERGWKLIKVNQQQLFLRE
jgi:predicted O-methyltransferase YrrM